MTLQRHLEECGWATTTRDLRAAGVDDHSILRAVRRGELRRVRRGAYVAVPPEDPFGAELHRRTAVALARERGNIALTHESAALVLGLPTLQVPGTVQAAALAETGGWATVSGISIRPPLPSSLLRNAPVPWADVTVATAPAAALQLACRGGDAALVVADAWLRSGGRAGELEQALVDLDPSRLRQRAADVTKLASPASESPGESRCRWLFHSLGWEQPEQQVSLWDGGRFLGRVDFLFRRQRTVVEFDGRVKYEGDALWREKQREQQLVRAGFRVVRLTWGDLSNPRLVERLIGRPAA